MVEGNDVQRDLGRMETQIGTLVAQVADLNKSVSRISATLAEAKGGWRVLLLIGGASGVVGAFIAKALPFLVAAK